MPCCPTLFQSFTEDYGYSRGCIDSSRGMHSCLWKWRSIVPSWDHGGGSVHTKQLQGKAIATQFSFVNHNDGMKKKS